MSDQGQMSACVQMYRVISNFSLMTKSATVVLNLPFCCWNLVYVLANACVYTYLCGVCPVSGNNCGSSCLSTRNLWYTALKGVLRDDAASEDDSRLERKRPVAMASQLSVTIRSSCKITMFPFRTKTSVQYSEFSILACKRFAIVPI